VLKSLAYHKPTPTAADKIAALRLAFSDLAERIESLAPASRERSVALTNLETAQMWTVKAIVLNDPESTVAE
jgi:hypothetical protein